MHNLVILYSLLKSRRADASNNYTHHAHGEDGDIRVTIYLLSMLYQINSYLFKIVIDLVANDCYTYEVLLFLQQLVEADLIAFDSEINCLAVKNNA